VLFSGPIAGDDEESYLKARVTPTPLQGRRRISAYDVLAVLLHESERRTPQQQRQAVTSLWCRYIAPSFESSEVLYFNFKGQKVEDPVLTLKQAFQMLLRIPSTPRVDLHRGTVAKIMTDFFADNELSVAEVKGSPACATLLSITGMRNDADNEHAILYNQNKQLRARLADAETALLLMQQQQQQHEPQHKRKKTSFK
jgi:hypothetical protein